MKILILARGLTAANIQEIAVRTTTGRTRPGIDVLTSFRTTPVESMSQNIASTVCRILLGFAETNATYGESG